MHQAAYLSQQHPGQPDSHCAFHIITLAIAHMQRVLGVHRMFSNACSKIRAEGLRHGRGSEIVTASKKSAIPSPSQHGEQPRVEIGNNPQLVALIFEGFQHIQRSGNSPGIPPAQTAQTPLQKLIEPSNMPTR